MNKGIIAVDFDGTLCKDSFPECGIVEPEHMVVHEYIRSLKKDGYTIILCYGRQVNRH